MLKFKKKSLGNIWPRLRWTKNETTTDGVVAVSPFFVYGWRMAIEGKGTSFAHVRT